MSTQQGLITSDDDDDLVILYDEQELQRSLLEDPIEIKTEPINHGYELQEALNTNPSGSVFELVNRAVHEQGRNAVEAIKTYQAYKKIIKQQKDDRLMADVEAVLAGSDGGMDFSDMADVEAVLAGSDGDMDFSNMADIEAVLADSDGGMDFLELTTDQPSAQVIHKLVPTHIDMPPPPEAGLCSASVSSTHGDLSPVSPQSETMFIVEKSPEACTGSVKRVALASSGGPSAEKQSTQSSELTTNQVRLVPSAAFNPATFESWDSISSQASQSKELRSKFSSLYKSKSSFRASKLSLQPSSHLTQWPKSTTNRSSTGSGSSSSRSSAREWPKWRNMTDEQKDRRREKRGREC